MELKRKAFIIKATPWRSSHLSRNHPEYSAIFDLIEHYKSETRFVLVGTSRAPTSKVLLKNGIVAWDIQTSGRLGYFAYIFDLMKLLLWYRPHVVIALGLLPILPVAIYSLLSWKSKYIPVFIGEFSYYGRKVTGKLSFVLGLRALVVALKLSHAKMLNMFAISRYIRERIETFVPKLSGKIRLVSYPIRFQHRGEYFSPKLSREPIVLTVAGIEPRKGLDTLIQAVSLIPRKFRVVMKGPVRDPVYMHKLNHMVKSFELEDRVTFDTDSVDYDALVAYYRSATLFVLPTREDCLGVVILEALHCGIPVIATSVGGIPDMIENGANGLLIQADDPLELANAISSILDNGALRRKLAANARSVLINRYYKNRITLKEALILSMR